MQNNRLIHAIIFIFILSVVGCQQQNEENQPLPTAFDLSIQATTDAGIIQSTEVGEPTVRSGLPTLPATYTPTPQATATPPEPTIAPTSTPTGFNAVGFIYYIFNGNSIMKLGADGTGETPIFTIPVGQMISDLTLSPDKTLLAYIAPGNGSAREVFISNLDGTYRQQVSCLGQSQVFNPTWSSDSSRIAFYAAQSEGMPLSIYSAAWLGSGNCPTENDQRQLVTLASSRLGGLVYSADNTQLFFSDTELYALNMQPHSISPPLNSNLGFGPDTNFAMNPANVNQLSYIYATSNSTEQQLLGELRIIDITQQNGLAPVVGEFRTTTHFFRWNTDGTRILASGRSEVFLFNPVTQNTDLLASEIAFLPSAIFSPDDSQIAYIDSNETMPAIPQVFTANTDGIGDPVQITNHVDGSIANLAWVAATVDDNE